ncbi:4-hydroxy-tetrahydrodipicolinate synthase [Paenarthrobacter sp. NPDC089322]|uniref:4-hydroxy-tetrahydrodipicolinate synthase n=1 Tax=Paenarthrobacter sp. NPDC089322 TaxID=3155065 RepID=UPI00341C83ED
MQPQTAPVAAAQPFGTLLTAMVTPFTAEGHVDFAAAGELAVYLAGRGSDGLVVCGTAGESSSLGCDEKEQLIREVRHAVGGRAKIVAGTGTNDTMRSVAMARRAARAGADGQLVVTPYYNKPTQGGLVKHFTDIAASSELPVMLYDNPGRTGLAITTSTLLRLAENPSIVAIKDAKADFAATTVVLAETDLAVYSGDDALALPWLAAGAAGLVSVSANVAPDLFRRLVDAVRAGDLPLARQLHFVLAPLARAVMNHIPPAAAAKYLMAEQRVLESPAVRAPLMTPTPDEAAAIRGELGEAALPLDPGRRHALGASES